MKTIKTNPNKPWKVVEVPTALGIVSGMFEGRLIQECDTKENADECAYLTWVDERSPDKVDYYSLRVVYYDK